jgi:ADP-ribose pyrophosphatase YjhB (NUDIX family)
VSVRAIRPGVSAVVLRDGQVLLQRRDDNRLWGIPGGSVEFGETVLMALTREVREETGLEVAPERLIGVYSDPAEHQIHHYPDGNVIHYVSVCFECRVLSGTLTLCEESLDLQWFDPDALPHDTMPVARIRVRDALTRADAPLIR